MALDELKDEDISYEYEGVQFIMEEFVHDQFGDFKVEYLGGGYMVAPAEQEPSDCSSCSGSCH